MVKARDPVCGMAVDTTNPPAQTTYQGRIYYFCAPACRNAFEANPGRYLPAGDHPDHEDPRDRPRGTA